MLRLTDDADETGRWCAHPSWVKGTGSHLSKRSETGPRFHFAFGFRTTQRLARMLDSLVRVSRRVGWRADRFATDPVPARWGARVRPREAVGRHGCPVSASRKTSQGGPGPPHETGGGSSVPGRIGTGGAIPVRAEAPTYHPRRLLTAPRTGRGALPAESAHGRTASCAGRVQFKISDPDKNNRRGQPSELNSAGRLCGSTRLPVGGFTYC